MIIEMILTPIFRLLGLLIDRIPDMSHIDPLAGHEVSGFIGMLAYGFYVFPVSLFLVFIGNILFWLSAQMIWAIIEWVYKKIPGVN
jgi:hypothetical protein